MSPAIESAKLFLLAALAFIGVGAAVGAAVHTFVAPRLRGWAPAARHRAWRFVAAVPALVALVLFVAVTLPPLAGLVWPALDHCPAHGGHAHLCFAHLPDAAAHPAVTALLALGLGALALRALRGLVALVRALGAIGSLGRTGARDPSLGVVVVDTASPICLAAGLVAPRIFVSRAVLDALSARELAIVLEHERAHAQRRHALVALVSSALATLHLPGIARVLTRELAVAAEQLADEAAARAADPVSVAEVVLKMERLALGAPALGGAAIAFVTTAVERRIHALLDPPGRVASLRPAFVVAAVLAIGLLAAAGELHHATESLLGRLAH